MTVGVLGVETAKQCKSKSLGGVICLLIGSSSGPSLQIGRRGWMIEDKSSFSPFLQQYYTVLRNRPP
jgi:hypothetical protein